MKGDCVRSVWNKAVIMRRILFAALLPLASVGAQILDPQAVLEREQATQVREALDHGIYDRVAKACEYVLQEGGQLPVWHEIRVQALVAQGKSAEALAALQNGVKKHPADLPLLVLQCETLRRYGEKGEAEKVLQAINAAARKKPASERTTEDLVALGKAALIAGADPSKVLSQYFSPAKLKEKKNEAGYLASGNLALDHADYSKAAESFRAGLKEHGESPELRYGLARAFAASDRAKSMEYLDRVLETNHAHEGALVLKAEHLISAEKFAEAEPVLAAAVETNPKSPAAWALRSVCNILRDNNPGKAAEARAEALKLWARDPQVDWLIGKCLSRAYRFAEGAQQQREVLAMEPGYLPAKLQLSNDLMRLGQTEEAWKLAAEIREADGYNTQAHNLGLLEREMSGFHIEKQEDFIIRLPQRDWEVYGPRALALLREAKEVLVPKYGHVFTKPTMVEFFPSQQDFAIRTFGALGGQGLLGVCFGTVITMNSPGSLAHGRSNWESTLWHEFCHVVTLSVTHNRMPRWLSEGISVYEERQRDPAWGMRMTKDFHDLVMDEKTLTPMGQLSGAFIGAKDQKSIMFAYYESSMAVEWMIAQHGWDAFRGVLKDLASGARINAALEKNIGPLEKLEPAFKEFMIAQAKAFAPGADWTKPEEKLGDSPEEVLAYLEQHPNNLAALQQLGDQYLNLKQWDKAAETGQKLIDLNPDDVSADSGWWIRGKAMHQQKNLVEETRLLREMASRSSDALPVFLRLIEIDLETQSWPEVQTDARRAFALNPFLPQPNEALATASQAQGQEAEALEAWQRLLRLEPANPARVRYQIATLLRNKDPVAAKRHLLDALVLAPRFKDAQKLLLEMQP